MIKRLTGDDKAQPAPSRARTLEAGKRLARLAPARAASRPGLCAIAPGRRAGGPPLWQLARSFPVTGPQPLSSLRRASAPVNHFIITCQPLDHRLLAALSSHNQLHDQRLLSRLISTSQPVDQHLSAPISSPISYLTDAELLSHGKPAACLWIHFPADPGASAGCSSGGFEKLDQCPESPYLHFRWPSLPTHRHPHMLAPHSL